MPDKTFEKFKEKLLEIEHLYSVLNILDWDTNVNMPPKGGEFRGQTMATVSGLVHDRLVAPDLEKILLPLKKKLDKKLLVSDQAAIVREVFRNYEKEKKLPKSFVKELSEATSQAHVKWVEARKNNSFKKFAPVLKKIVELKRKQAKLIGWKESPYDALIDDFEPGLTSAEASLMFYELKQFLVPFIKKISQKKIKLDPKLTLGHFDLNRQKEFNEFVARTIGYDLKAGRIDQSAHPFSTNFNMHDTRITTRYSESDVLYSLGSTIHEVGHALYEQGLKPEHFGTPLGNSISLGIHESQSRVWENMVGKSLPFWKYFNPKLSEFFPSPFKKIKLEQLYSTINVVHPSLIRVESDEVTYNLHIIIRFEIEKDLIEGTIEVEDLPKIWNAKYKEYLGLNVPNDSLGVLQDVHWSAGLFGYFPTYTLGNLYSAQFYQQAKKDVRNMEKLFEKGKFQPFLAWLRKNIHQHGRMYSAQELCERITGEGLNIKYYTDYLENKFGKLYKL